jgi:hypothetical protein
MKIPEFPKYLTADSLDDSRASSRHPNKGTRKQKKTKRVAGMDFMNLGLI